MITLPTWVSPATTNPRLMDMGVWNKPALGGTYTRTDRPGSRYAITVTLPPVENEERAHELIADITAAKRQGLRMPWTEGPKMTGSGTPTVRINNQSGTTINITGLPPQKEIKKGQFFSVTRNGQSYLHHVSATTGANLNGNTILTIEPETRAIFQAGDVVDFETPHIEGVIEGDDWGWERRVGNFLAISFELVERQ